MFFQEKYYIFPENIIEEVLMKRLVSVLLLILIFFFLNCASSGMYLNFSNTQVVLEEANYKIIATNVTGQAEASYLLGVSYSFGSATETLALFKLDGSGFLYQEAMEDLWNNFRKTHGEVENRTLGLTNIRYDSEVTNFLVYTSAKVMIQADIIEFKNQ